jgi:PAS domain S-box-containing protein
MEGALSFDDMPAAVVVYDADGTLINANRAAYETLGVAEGTLVGTSAARAGWLVARDKASEAEFPHPAVAAAQTRLPQTGVLARVSRPDGADIWIQVDAFPHLTSTGRVVNVVATLTDVTRIVDRSRQSTVPYGDEIVAAVTEQLGVAPMDHEGILQTVTSTLSKWRSGTWVATLMKKDPRTVWVVAANDADPQVAAYIEAMNLRPDAPSFTVATRVMETGQPELIASVPYDTFIGTLNGAVREHIAKTAPPISSPVGSLGVLVVPMRVREAVVGTIGLFERDSSRRPTESDQRWLQVVADRTGLAAESAQLRIDSARRLERLTALRSVGLAIGGSPDLRLTLRVILDRAIAGLEVDAADVLLLDQKDSTLGLVDSSGFRSTSMPDYRLPVDEGLPGRALMERRVQTINDSAGFTRFRRASLFAREGFQAYAAAPLIARGKLVGVLEVFHRSPLEADREWSDFLDALASEAAIAIHSADMIENGEQTRSDRRPRATAPRPDLSRVENLILTHVVEGLSNRVIANKVHLSEHTIKFHIGHLLDRLEVSNRTELARKVTREGWL